ncbi:TRAP transporter large permease subunit [Sulfitobacter geojensis]|uniref:TRAP transporter large permease subunit n=2 Tax=Sulfitobacter geojensis TaxID=1342299 RepID=A0AAE3B7U0_9RHOB|nr:TRAP transporter large permease subunit [Sulfitobacter geojensis]MBM1691326.1 TRAP transporter large permease subunit [Sulfitobacter geojensis]MBM1695351.1 TRAP transporter large permease subunit [Sulfitobacter geojensis]MBM1707451.1 TRAP transporter large permease subunit [Sulfitobacter geojensis]MBM1711642.1 TRAP transporter large permease subunit [Sulfitobacter geojensis]MBM1715617.1 TRAP transporter large permease subunit [Sulfitobacter geojensis]
MWRGLSGDSTLRVRAFATEWFYPVVFLMMMTIVALKHSMRRAWRGTSWAGFGLLMDVALVAAAALIALTYLIEIDSVCLIDRLNGDRARLIGETLKAEVAFAKEYGLPVPDTVDDPKCITTTGVWLVLIMGVSVLVFLGYTVRVWGLALVVVALGAAVYAIATVLVWYFHGSDDINKYLMTKLGGEPRQFLDGRPNVHDALVNNASGMLGRFMYVTMNMVFPYIILGALFGKSAGGRSLIKLAFRWTRHLHGGPAHGAIVASAMFGTITGGPVSNVMSTGALTIPMMIKRGFSPVFAGGVEAAASSGGAIMPPIMGVAAFVLAAMTGTPYGNVIIAATIPAVAYFFCLFLKVTFQSRKLGFSAYGTLTEDMLMSRREWLLLAQIVLPILLILILLLTPKDRVGCGLLGWVLGAQTDTLTGVCRATDLQWVLQIYQNAAGDAGATGWWGAAFVCGLLFLDRDFRKSPRKVFDALAEAGMTVSSLYLMFLAVTVIDVCLNFTGLSKFVAVDVLRFLLSLDLGGEGSVVFLFVALGVTMVLAVLLGLGMPAVPAYINAALLMGPLLIGLGIATFTAHMFIFYFAVASAITPPVALAAFAAASITKAEPMETAVSAVRSGIVMFCIPLVFAFYPEILLIDQALIDPQSLNRSFLPGYENGVQVLPLLWLLARLALALYLVASALSRFDIAPLGAMWVTLRLAIAVGLLARPEIIHLSAIVAALAVLGHHRARSVMR